MEGYVDLRANLELAKGVKYRESTDGESVYIPAADIELLTFPDKNLRFRAVRYSYRAEDGTLQENTPRLGQVIYADDRFELTKLNLSPAENNYTIIDDIESAYFAHDFRDERSVALKVEERVESETKFQRLDLYRGALTVLFREFPYVKYRIDRAKYNDHGLIRLFREVTQISGSPDSSVYEYVPKKDVDRKKAHYISLGTSLLGAPEPGYILTLPVLGYTYEVNRPRKNPETFNQFGFEFVPLSPRGDFDFEGTNDRAIVLNLKIMSRSLLSDPAQNVNLFSVGYGITNHLVFVSGERDVVVRTTDDNGNVTTLVTGQEDYNEFGIIPFNFRVFFQYDINRLSIKAYGELSIAARLNPSLMPAGIQIGYRL